YYHHDCVCFAFDIDRKGWNIWCIRSNSCYGNRRFRCKRSDWWCSIIIFFLSSTRRKLDAKSAIRCFFSCL
uniref:Ovule protein n=1 Tax=Parascaris univalens TaxID=6257 RepID=A0A915ADZ1_PARUN